MFPNIYPKFEFCGQKLTFAEFYSELIYLFIFIIKYLLVFSIDFEFLTFRNNIEKILEILNISYQFMHNLQSF